jgi:hypothetical protein
LILWLAFEALTPLLTEHYGVEPEGFQGLRALAAEDREDGSEFISQALGLRRDLFHTRRVPIEGMKERARNYLPRLQRLLVLGWLTILDRDQSELALFPKGSGGSLSGPADRLRNDRSSRRTRVALWPTPPP